MKQLIQYCLVKIARAILRRHQPDIIGITGSVGKTSTRSAVVTVLQSKFTVRTALKNLNNEFGVPLTIIGSDSPGRNPFGWLAVLLKGLAYVVLPVAYPKIVVLEMGADHPGDIKYLTKIAPPHIGVVTMIGTEPAHVEFFRDIDQLAQEKFVMYKRLGKNDWAIVNLDEPRSVAIQPNIKGHALTISTEQPADFLAREIHYSTNPRQVAERNAKAGLTFKLQYQGSVVPCFIPGAVGMPQVYAALIATAIGTIYGMNLIDITAALQYYTPPPGRMRLLPGKTDSVIIDDSYNASPAAVREALAVLAKMETTGPHIACLGDMAELGSYAKRAHQQIGKLISTLPLDYLVTVGPQANWIAEAAVAYGFDRVRVVAVTDAAQASTAVAPLLQSGSVLLVKGSQSMRLEKVVKAFMAEPDRAAELLVRQYGQWTKV